MTEKQKQARARRIDYVLRRHGSALWRRFEQQEGRWEGVPDCRSLVELLAGADPSPAGECLPWLAQTYARGGFRLEDLNRTRETLVKFQSIKSTLLPQQRSLFRYKSEAALWQALGETLNEPVVSSRATDRADRERARDESTILLDEPGRIVAIPRTEFAAKWWGRGTRWCTAADDDNKFEIYAAQGDLVVIIADGLKYQAHAAKGQFMDAADNSVDVKQLITAHPWLTNFHQVAECVLEVFPSLLVEPWVTPEMRLAAVQRHGHSLRFFADTATSEERMAAVQQNGYAIRHFTDTATSEERLAAIRQHGRAIQYFAATATPEERLAAVKRDWGTIEYFADTATPEERLAAVQQDGHAIQHLLDLDTATSEERLEAVQQNGWAILHFLTLRRRRSVWQLSSRQGELLNVFRILPRLKSGHWPSRSLRH